MWIQNGQERILSPPNSYFPISERQGRDIQASHEPRTSPKPMMRSRSPPCIRSLQRKRLPLKHSKFTRKQKKKPEYVLKSWQPAKPEDPHPSCPHPRETRTNGCSQALSAESGAELQEISTTWITHTQNFGVVYLLLKIPLVCTGPFWTNPTSSKDIWRQEKLYAHQGFRSRSLWYLSVFSNAKCDTSKLSLNCCH